MSNENLRCYNCGIQLTKDTKTREHIPAQNTFVGYSPEYKKNRITVPACHTCNNEYSKIDQEIRDAIGVINEDNEKQKEITRKAAKSITRNRNWTDRINFRNGQVASVSFSYNKFKKLHIKNFKGLFYHKYGFPIPENYEIAIIAEGDEGDKKLMGIAQNWYNYVAEGDNWNASGHKDIFQFKIKYMTCDENDTIIDGGDIKDAIAFVGVLVYHKTLCPVIFAAKEDFSKK